MLSKVVSSTIFKVFGMTRPGIEPRSPGPLANTLTAGPMSRYFMFIYRYHIITDVYTTALLLTKPSSDDDSGFEHGFGVEASLPLAQSDPTVSHDTTRLCQIVVAL